MVNLDSDIKNVEKLKPVHNEKKAVTLKLNTIDTFDDLLTLEVTLAIPLVRN